MGSQKDTQRMNPAEGLELLTSKLKANKANAEFLMSMNPDKV